MALLTNGCVIIETIAGEIVIESWTKVKTISLNLDLSISNEIALRKHPKHVETFWPWLWRDCESSARALRSWPLMVYFLGYYYGVILHRCGNRFWIGTDIYPLDRAGFSGSNG